MPEQAVADTATADKRVPSGRTGGPTKAVQQARSRAKRDPVASVESDSALDAGPDYRMEGRVEIPKPPHFRFGTDQPSPRRPEHFLQWWCGLTAAQKRKCIVYVYRNYPVIGVKVPDNKSPTGFRVTAQIDKRSGTDTLASLDDILHHYGSGDYTIRLNQADPNKAVCLCVIKGLRDEQHPPVVDLGTLVIDDPVNRPYIEGLRLRGVRVPGVDAINEEDQMGAAAVSQLVGTVTDLAQRNTDLAVKVGQAEAAKTARDEKDKKPSADESIVSQALATGMKIISDASTTQSNMLKSAMDKVTEIRATAPAAPAAPAADPLAMIESVGNLLKSLAPPAASTSQLDMLMAASLKRADTLEEKLFTLQSQQLTFLQSMLTQSQQAQSAAAAARPGEPVAPRRGTADSTVSPSTPLDMLRELIKLKDGLSSLSGESGGGEVQASPRSNPSTPWWAVLLQNLPSLVQMGATIASMVAVTSYNNAVAKTGTGNPAPVPVPVITPPADTDAKDEPGSDTEIPLPPADATASDLPQPGDATLNAYHIFLRQLEKPLILALENNEPGDQFAEKLVGWQGQVAYDLLHGLGRDQLIQILSTYPPIWTVVSAIPSKFNQFLEEFMSYGDADSGDSIDAAPAHPAHPPAHAPAPAPAKGHNPRATKKSPSPNPNPAGPATQ